MKKQMFVMMTTIPFLWMLCVNALANTVEIRPQDFGSLVTLDDAISRTVKDHAKVKEAMARLDKERALYIGSRSEFFPKLATEVFAFGASGKKHMVSNFNTTLEQPIFQGGKAVYGKRKQKVRVEEQELRLDQAKQDLEIEVRILYARALKEKELLRISQNAVKEISQRHHWFRAIYEKELITAFEMARIESLLAKAKGLTVKHKETYDYLISVLKQVMGIQEEEDLHLEALTSLPAIQPSVESYLDAFRNGNPLYKLTTLELKEKEFEKKILQSDRYPHISLAVKWDVNNDVFVNNNRGMAGVLGKWAIWDFGRLGSQIKAKSHEIEEVRWQGVAKIQKEEREIYRLFHEARAVRERIRMFDAQIREKEESYKNEKTRLVAGQRTETEILGAYLMLEDMRTAYIDAVTQYRIIVSTLESRIGFKGAGDE